MVKKKISMPDDLFDAMFELKALGNDAAHIEAKAYTEIGIEESRLSIEIAKEILKSLFQMRTLLNQLRSRSTKK